MFSFLSVYLKTIIVVLTPSTDLMPELRWVYTLITWKHAISSNNFVCPQTERNSQEIMLLRMAMERLTGRDERRENEMTDIKQGLERHRAENEDLRQGLERRRAENEDLRQGLERRRAENEDLRQDLDRCTQDVEKYRAENVDLRQDLERHRAENVDLRQDLDRCTQDLERYRAENEDLRMESEIWRETMQNTNRVIRWYINKKYVKNLAEAQRRQRNAQRQEPHE